MPSARAPWPLLLVAASFVAATMLPAGGPATSRPTSTPPPAGVRADAAGFASNVDGRRPPWAGTLETSRTRMAGLGGTITNAAQTDDGTLRHVEGRFGGVDLRPHARAVLHDGVAWLVTAAAKPEQWAPHGDRLRACVASFRIDEPRG